MVKFGFQEPKKTTTSSSAAAATKNTTMSSKSATVNPAKTKENIYENQAAEQGGEEDHTYSTAEYANMDKSGKHEFPAKSDDNANIWFN